MDGPKERHGCLTAWLVLMIVANGLTAVAMPLMVGPFLEEYPNAPPWVVWPIAANAALNVVFAFALFNWKKWGFVGFFLNNVVLCALNLYAGIGVFQSVAGLLGLPILYGVLQIGRPKSGWDQLE